MFLTPTKKILNSSSEIQKECFKLLLQNLEHDFIQSEVDKLIENKDYTKEYLDCSIDFNTINVFSIERVFIGTKHEITVIGYLLDNNVKEWKLEISRENHKRLIEQYEQHKKNV